MEAEKATQLTHAVGKPRISWSKSFLWSVRLPSDTHVKADAPDWQRAKQLNHALQQTAPSG
jgi:hypothetical protein